MATSKLKKGAIYYYKWQDASASLGWKTKEEAVNAPTTIVESIGVFVGENKTEYVFCSDCSAEGKINSVAKLPKGMLLSARKLR